MMMQPLVDPRAWMTEAELKAHYAEIRKRLYGCPNKEVPEPQKLPKPVWKGGISVQSIIMLVAAYYKITKMDILEGKTAGLVRVRYITMFLGYHCGKKSMRHIAREMNMHLNSVCEGIGKIIRRREYDAMLDSEMNALRAQIEELGLHHAHQQPATSQI